MNGSYIDAIMGRLSDHIDAIDVRDSIDLAAAERAHQRDTLYVVPGAVDGGVNEDGDGGATQRLGLSVLVLIALTNRRARGSGARRDLASMEDSVILALAGWTPAGLADPLSYGRGALLGFYDGAAWWKTEFNTARWIAR